MAIALATMHPPGVTGSVVLHVNEQGQLTHVTADRYKEEHRRYLLAPWSGQCSEYQEVEGMRIPTRIAHHLASRLRGLHLVSLQDHPDRIQPIGKGDEIIRDA